MKCKCMKCGHKWVSRVENPKACPACKRFDWNEENDAGPIKCAICGDELQEGPIYRLQEGKNSGGVFVSTGNSGVYCSDCTPEEDVLPFS